MAICLAACATKTSLVADVPKTILQIRAASDPSNWRLRVLRWSISFNGISAADRPVLVELLRQNGGTFLLSPAATAFDDSIAEAVQSKACTGCTVEPATTNLLDAFFMHPQGRRTISYAFNQQPMIAGLGNRLGIRITAPKAVSCLASVIYEE